MAFTLTVATKIANYGADKMDAQGYKIERMANSVHGFYVDRPATETEEAGTYIVGILGDFTSCTCPFHAENKVCKHTVACERFIADEARYDEMEALLQEAEDWGQLGWPSCEYHGPYESAANGFPLSWCEGCERVAL